MGTRTAKITRNHKNQQLASHAECSKAATYTAQVLHRPKQQEAHVHVIATALADAKWCNTSYMQQCKECQMQQQLASHADSSEHASSSNCSMTCNGCINRSSSNLQHFLGAQGHEHMGPRVHGLTGMPRCHSKLNMRSMQHSTLPCSSSQRN